MRGGRRTYWVAAALAAMAATVGAAMAGPTSAAPAEPAAPAAPTSAAPAEPAAPAAPAQAEPTATVDPAADLVDGTPVTIEVSGLEPAAFVDAAQCTAGATSLLDDCDYFDDGAFAIADGQGNATLSLRVDALLTAGFGGDEIDCRTADCVVGVATEDDFGTIVALAALEFRPDGPLAPPPVLTVQPDTGLGDLEVVHVAGSGFVWTRQVSVIQCAAGASDGSSCAFDGLTGVQPSADGSFTLDYPVSAVIDTEAGLVDCRQPGACMLAAGPRFSITPAKSAAAPLEFDSDAELVVGTITVTPDRDLADGQPVHVEGSAFRPDGGVELFVCASEPRWETCQSIDFAIVDAAGTFEADVTVTAVVPTEAGEVDCRTVETCMLVASSSGSPSSPRAGQAPLHFDPDIPLLPGPEITVTPSTDLPDEATLTVTGNHFTVNGDVTVEVCRTGGGFDACDPQTGTYLVADGSGAFSVEIGAAARFESWDDEPVDCRQAPGCEVVGHDWGRGRTARASLAFAPPESPGSGGVRYREEVFHDVEVTRDVVYRTTEDAHGTPVQLTLDIYEPAGDTADMRPAVVWMHGGWFADGERADMAAYAEAFARRGYVAVSMEYRMRPDLDCCPARDAIGIHDALVDGGEDAMAGLEWLHEHADEYRIDHEAIAVGGDGAGAANAFSLAFTGEAPGYAGGGGHEHGLAALASMDDGPMPDDTLLVAAALPISGVSLGRPAEDAPPVLAFHGTEDTLAPPYLTELNCAHAQEMGATCETVSYQGAFDDIAFSRERDIIRRSSDFLADEVLEPLGYFEEEPAPSTTSTTVSGGGSGGTTTTVSPAGSQSAGTLSRTGADTWPLVWAGVGLAGLGTAALAVRRLLVRRRGRAITGVVLTVALAGAMVAPHDAHAAEDPPAGEDTTTTTTTTVADEPAPDPEAPLPTAPDDTVPSPPPSPPESTTTTLVTAPEPQAPMPGEPMPEDPALEDMEDICDPTNDVLDGCTPERIAFVHQLIADTEAALERYANPAILGLLGYVWITDGRESNQYQHWVNLGLIVDGRTLDPEFPESLVLYNTGDDLELQAAMFILSTLGMENIPEDIAWLAGWHIHDNLCWDGQRLTGLADENGNCERGFLLVTPPMTHVWIVDTPCGRFVGIDEHGLMCDHQHEG